MTEPEQMRDHWWWRPGWKTGRSFFTWHFTFADQPAAAQLVAHYAPLLDTLPTLDPVPLRWLHLTTQGIGFTDEVDHGDVDSIVDATRRRCARLEPFAVQLGPAHLDPETIQMPAQPAEPLVRVRHAIRDAIAEVWGPNNVPEPEDGFRAHVTLAYSNAAGPMEPIRAALNGHNPYSADVPISKVSLIKLNRDNRAYEWTDYATIKLG